MFIQRNWKRSEADDFKLNVERYIGDFEAATPIYDKDGIIIGWKIDDMYE